ncbi:hypothetical protein DPMN_011249 [Dreissena polymorpha]|uniref:Uncharacterized protein n=1 Tax=Dreissena polymorpha TaxID=45954 RepID=A0A9D4S1R1_DREPO|nr:hypothetical protein DPMN_011249 [Dreissena polymorpha]
MEGNWGKRVEKNAPPLGNLVLQAKFHEDRKINVASRVLTRLYYSHFRNNSAKLSQDTPTQLLTKFGETIIRPAFLKRAYKNALPPGSHVFQPTGIIFVLFQDIIGMNLLTKFHEDQTINVASRVLTRFYYSHITKNAPPHGSHVFQANTNLLTKFHEDWTINVASIENAPPPGSHVLKPSGIIF